MKGGISNFVDALNNAKSDAESALSSTVNNAKSDAESKVESAISSTVNNAKSDAESKVESALSGALSGTLISNTDAFSKMSELKSGFDTAKKFIINPLTPGDKFRHALLKLITNPEFKSYFANKMNKIMVSEFYKILIQLGKYSKIYSDTVKEIGEITGEKMFDEDDDFYSDLNEDNNPLSNNLEEETEIICKKPDEPEDDEELNIKKIIDDDNINEFLKDVMILSVPVFDDNFNKLGKIIEKYKKLRNKMNALLQKAEKENKIDYDKFEDMAKEANEQIKVIFFEFETKPETTGGTTDVKDDFNNSLLKMCIYGKNNLSKLLKQKLSVILNKIIKRLYDIANSKKIIDGEEDYDENFVYLKTDVESNKFDIDKFENENLEIFKFQKEIIEIIEQMFCKIQTKSDMDSQPFKDIVKPAFIKKKEQFRDLNKIWSKDVKEMEQMMQKLDPIEITDVKDYMDKLKAQLQIATNNQSAIKEYVKSIEEIAKAEKILAKEVEKKEKAESDRLEKAEKILAKAESDRLEKAEKILAKAESDRLEKAKAKAESDRLVKIEADRLAKIEAERLAKENAPNELNFEGIPKGCNTFMPLYNEYKKQYIALTNLNTKSQRSAQLILNGVVTRLDGIRSISLRGDVGAAIKDGCPAFESWYNKNKKWFSDEFEQITQFMNKYNENHKDEQIVMPENYDKKNVFGGGKTRKNIKKHLFTKKTTQKSFSLISRKTRRHRRISR